jgi:RNA polymerase sigma factor (sigma-70 family)
MAAEPRTQRLASGEPSSNGRSACAPAETGPLEAVPADTARDELVAHAIRSAEAKAGLTPVGDSTWLSEVIERFEGPLVRYAARISGDLERGRDVVQETFLRFCREPTVAAGDYLPQWLFTVCRRLALDVRRKETRMNTKRDAAAVCELPARTGSESGIEHAEQAGQVVQWIDALPANQQEVVRLKFQEGMSYKAIAAITGHSVSNVGYLLHTAVTTLRKRMNADLGSA